MTTLPRHPDQLRYARRGAPTRPPAAPCRRATWPTSTWPAAARPSPSSASRAFRAEQLSTHYFGRLVRDPAAMTDLPAASPRPARRRRCCRTLLTPVRELACDDGATRKTLWRLHDGALVESVLMGYPDRVTVCVSSQAGCGMACPFCATGQAGLTRNLSTAEIVDQVVYLAGRGRLAARSPGRRRGCPTSSSWAWASRWPTTPG